MSATDAAAMDPAAAAAAAAAQLTALNAAVDGAVMPIVIGCFLSCVVLGLLLAASVQYFSSFPNDRWQYKVLVAGLTVASLADTGNACAWAYYYAVESFLEPANLALWPRYFTVFGAITGTTIFICQLFFIWRGWIVAGRDKYLMTAVQLIIAIGATVCVFLLCAMTRDWVLLSDMLSHKGIAYGWLAGGLLVDLLITGYLVYNLLFAPRKERGNVAIQSTFKRLAILAVKTNTASLVVQLTVLAVMVAKPTLHYAIAGMNETKVYAISVIITLNARNSSKHGTSSSYGGGGGTSDNRARGLGASSPFNKVPPQSAPIVHVHRSVLIEGDQESQHHHHQQGGAPDYEDKSSYALFVLRNDSRVEQGKETVSEKAMGREQAF